MPYLTIVQAAEATGKSEKTIRRLIKQPKSASYVTRESDSPNAPVQIDAAYLQTVYPMSAPPNVGQPSQDGSGQAQDSVRTSDQTTQLSETQADYIGFLKEELKKREEQLAAKDRRIEDLTDKLTHIRLLTEGPPKEDPAADPKKKSWWRW